LRLIISKFNLSFNAAKGLAAYAVCWGFIEAGLFFFPIISSEKCVKIAILACLVPTCLYLSIKFEKRDKPIETRVSQSIEAGILYLNSANSNEQSQRMRTLPSIMETSTVIGCIATCRKDLPFDAKLLEWTWTGLKSRLRDRRRVECFDCTKCNKEGEVCLLSYFDYCSHFYYAQNDKIKSRFDIEFSFLGDQLAKYFISKGDQVGFPQRPSKNFDVHSTATCLILALRFDALKYEQAQACLYSIEKSLAAVGKDLFRAAVSQDPALVCSATYQIISAHRTLEAINEFNLKFASKRQFEHLAEACQKYLITSPSEESAMSYFNDSGIDRRTHLRALGHIVQGLIKPLRQEHVTFVESRVELILELQNQDGSYSELDGVFGARIDQANRTDLTAFLTRTLFFYQAARSGKPL
jgi:hypothetical protein